MTRPRWPYNCAMPAVCRQCKNPVADESKRKPCPVCGCSIRDYTMAAEPGKYELTGSNARLTVQRLWPTLLATADRLLDADEHGVAVVVAQTACEVVVEKALAKTPHKRPLTYSRRGEK